MDSDYYNIQRVGVPYHQQKHRHNHQQQQYQQHQRQQQQNFYQQNVMYQHQQPQQQQQLLDVHNDMDMGYFSSMSSIPQQQQQQQQPGGVYHHQHQQYSVNNNLPPIINNPSQQYPQQQQMTAHPVCNYYNNQSIDLRNYGGGAGLSNNNTTNFMQNNKDHQQSLVHDVCENYANPSEQHQSPSPPDDINTPDAGSNKNYHSMQTNKSVVSTPFMPTPWMQQNYDKQSYNALLYETSLGIFGNNLPRYRPSAVLDVLDRQIGQGYANSLQGSSIDLQLQIQQEITIAEQAMKDARSALDLGKQQMEREQQSHKRQLEIISELEQQKERYTSDTDIFARLSEYMDQAMDDNNGNIDQAADDNILRLMNSLSINEDNSNQQEDFAIKVAYTSLIKMVKRRRDRISSSLRKERSEEQKILTAKNDAEAEYVRLTADTKAKEKHYREAKEEHDQVVDVLQQQQQKPQLQQLRRPEATLFIRNIPDETTEEDMRALFEPHGLKTNNKVLSVTLNPARGFCFVDFDGAEGISAIVKEATTSIKKDPRTGRKIKSSFMVHGRVLEVERKVPKQQQMQQQPKPAKKQRKKKVVVVEVDPEAERQEAELRAKIKANLHSQHDSREVVEEETKSATAAALQQRISEQRMNDEILHEQRISDEIRKKINGLPSLAYKAGVNNQPITFEIEKVTTFSPKSKRHSPAKKRGSDCSDESPSKVTTSSPSKRCRKNNIKKNKNEQPQLSQPLEEKERLVTFVKSKADEQHERFVTAHPSTKKNNAAAVLIQNAFALHRLVSFNTAHLKQDVLEKALLNMDIGEMESHALEKLAGFQMAVQGRYSDSTKQIGTIVIKSIVEGCSGTIIGQRLKALPRRKSQAIQGLVGLPSLAIIVARGSSKTNNDCTSQSSRCMIMLRLLVNLGILPTDTEVLKTIYAALDTDKGLTYHSPAFHLLLELLLDLDPNRQVIIVIEAILVLH